MNTLEAKQAWLNCPAMTAELKSELTGMDQDALSDAFYRDLAFGTGGLRGVLGAGTNRMNLFTVAKATKGLGTYLKEAFSVPSCAISFDSRIHSEDFARLAAAVLADMGIAVWIYPALQPTPMLSFAVRHHGTSAGIMITASHNPAKFNGYKVYGPDGCQITVEAADRIQHFIDLQPVLTDSFPSYEMHLADESIRLIPQETIEAYYAAVSKLSVQPIIQPIHLVYSPLNGTGNIPVREMLHRMGNISVDIVEEQEKPDGHFPTCPYPNPEIREAMELAIRKTLQTKADFCFATDPDCDRMGAGVRVDSKVELISGNDMGILMLDFLCRNRPIRTDLPAVVVKTIVTTEMAAALCSEYGLELRNVLTGFKFIGEQIGLLEKNGELDRFLFGFEESYGYLSGTDVRDKDAVNAALLLCEMASDLKAHGKTMLDRLAELRCKYGFFGQRLLTFQYEGESGAKQMSDIMALLRTGSVSELVAPLDPETKRTDYLTGDTGLPKSDVISFQIGKDLKWIVRPSGTEPKLKAYLFAHAGSEKESVSLLDTLQRIAERICSPAG